METLTHLCNVVQWPKKTKKNNKNRLLNDLCLRRPADRRQTDASAACWNPSVHLGRPSRLGWLLSSATVGGEVALAP